MKNTTTKVGEIMKLMNGGSKCCMYLCKIICATIVVILSCNVTAQTRIPYTDFLKGLCLTDLTSSEKKDRFFSFINDDIPKYWAGTGWDFNGTTRSPQNGKIACGYFVTNVLSDFGMKIRRAYLAQQASSIMIKELCDKSSIKKFSNISQVQQYLNNRNEKEIFIVGLDFHTGFIIKDGIDYYFLHSNYINQQGVTKEKLDESSALKSSNLFVIGSLTVNTNLFE